MGAVTSTAADSEVKDLFQKASVETDEFIQSLYKGKKLARLYDTYRPGYPREIFDEITSYHREVLTNGHQLAVDVCCGTGLSTLPLVRMFDKVIGVDVSEDLMEYMPRDVPNLTAHVCPAENMTMIDSGTVDLVTIATGLHWVNIEKFLQEAKRILKPGGTFAAYTWRNERIENEEANLVYREFLIKLKNFMTSRPRVAYEKFQSVEFPFINLRRFEMEVCDEITVEQFKGYVSSVHLVPLFDEANPGNDEMGHLEDSLNAILNHDGRRESRDVTLKFIKSLFLIVGRNV